MFDELEANGKCRSCGAPIRWVKTQASANMPLNLEPCEDGNIVIASNGEAIVVGTKPAYLRRPLPRYKSHFATCPNAAEHRRKRG